MPRLRLLLVLPILLMLAMAASPVPVSAAPAQAEQTAVRKKPVKRMPKGVGFLPGYRTPAQIERDRHNEIQRERRAYYRAGGPRIAYWRYAQPQFYRGRWNGGDFGPCWTSTPIGYQWNCGK